MNGRILISFIGSHDKKANMTDGPISQLINYIHPHKTYLLLTEEYHEEFFANKLDKFYNDNFECEFEILNTGIKNPINHEEIATLISPHLDTINKIILETKSQAYVNLTSGTPAIISVLSLFIMTGQLNRTVGAYAPNPKFDNTVKLDTLGYYRNSFAYRMIQSLINNSNYDGVEYYLTHTNKNDVQTLVQNKEFMELLKFAKNRFIGNFSSIEEQKKTTDLTYIKEYLTPKNLYERAVEFYNCAQISIERKNDIFQGVLKLGIIRENLVKYLCEKLIERHYPKLNILKHHEDKRSTFNLKELDEHASDMKEYIKQRHRNGNTKTEFDFTRDIETYGEGLILEFLLKVKSDETNKTLSTIRQKINSLNTLIDVRNKLAHTLTPPKNDPSWLKNLKLLLDCISDEFGEKAPDFAIYSEINKTLIEMLKKALLHK